MNFFRKSISLASLGLLLSLPSLADVRIFNASNTNLTVELTLPNGEVSTKKFVQPNLNGKTYAAAVDLDEERIKSAPMKITSEAGEVLYTGIVANGSAYVLRMDGTKLQLVTCGTDTRKRDSSKIGIASGLNESYKVDLVGNGGVYAQRGITLDPAQVVLINTAEADNTYFFKICDTAGNVLAKRLDNGIHDGKIYVLTKVGDDFMLEPFSFPAKETPPSIPAKPSTKPTPPKKRS